MILLGKVMFHVEKSRDSMCKVTRFRVESHTHTYLAIVAFFPFPPRGWGFAPGSRTRPSP